MSSVRRMLSLQTRLRIVELTAVFIEPPRVAAHQCCASVALRHQREPTVMRNDRWSSAGRDLGPELAAER